MKDCSKCGGSGRLPKWPKPYTPLTPGIISRIRENAPKCDECEGTGEEEEEGDE